MTTAATKPVILIVDDEVELCDTIALTFSIRGFSVLSAYNGKDALNILKSTPVDVVLSDVRMAQGSGPELVKWIREAKINIPVIAFMSGYSDVTPKEIADLDVALFFDKPFPVNSVIQSIKDKLAAVKGSS